MSQVLNVNFTPELNKPLDDRYGVYNSVNAALIAIPLYRRYLGLTIGVGTPVQEYWFEDGITDSDLVTKSLGSSTLVGLSDVDVTNLLDGNIIVYNALLDKWVNQEGGTVPSGTLDIDGGTFLEPGGGFSFDGGTFS
jgi:hypothetical protein